MASAFFPLWRQIKIIFFKSLKSMHKKPGIILA